MDYFMTCLFLHAQHQGLGVDTGDLWLPADCCGAVYLAWGSTLTSVASIPDPYLPPRPTPDPPQHHPHLLTPSPLAT